MTSVKVVNISPSTSYRTIRQGPAVTFSPATPDKFYGGSTATGDFIFTHKSTDADLFATAGDAWIQIGPNQWIAQIHGGKVVTDLVVTPIPSPSTAPTISLPVTFTDENGVTWVTTFSGTMEKKV